MYERGFDTLLVKIDGSPTSLVIQDFCRTPYTRKAIRGAILTAAGLTSCLYPVLRFVPLPNI